MSTQLGRNAGDNVMHGSSNGAEYLDSEENQSFDGIIDSSIHSLVEWLNYILPHLKLPLDASEEELRLCLIDGTVLCSILNKLSPGLIEMRGNSQNGPANIKKFLAAMDDMGLPRFVLADIEQGYMVPVLQCLGTLRANFVHNMVKESIQNHTARRWNLPDIEFSDGNDRVQRDLSTFRENSLMYGIEGKKNSVDGKYQHISHGSIGEGWVNSEENLEGNCEENFIKDGSKFLLEILLDECLLLFPRYISLPTCSRFIVTFFNSPCNVSHVTKSNVKLFFEYH